MDAAEPLPVVSVAAVPLASVGRKVLVAAAYDPEARVVPLARLRALAATPNGPGTKVAPAGDVTDAKAAMPSACEPESAKATPGSRAPAALRGAQPCEGELSSADAGHEEHPPDPPSA